jgi:phosphoribosylformylglycinamidine cyclo-ligase
VGETYAGAGVSIEAGEEAVRRIGPLARSTFRPEVLADIGAFGSLVAIPERYRDPVLVSSTDGVGTKLLVAEAAARFDTIGIDLVAMCVDDVAVHGAEPLFFLDYIAVDQVEPSVIETLVSGMVEACRQAGCALVGGEIAEHGPGHRMELAGFAVGVVERNRVITAESVRPGDALVGLPSPGLRSNGYSLARRALLDIAGGTLDEPAWPGADHTLADELLRPSVIYAPAIAALGAAVEVRAFAHITGGGLPGNLVRVLPSGCAAVLERGAWPVPPIFDRIQRAGDVADDEMERVFNLGIGMVAIVAPADAERAQDVLLDHGGSHPIGRVVAGERRVAWSR